MSAWLVPRQETIGYALAGSQGMRLGSVSVQA